MKWTVKNIRRTAIGPGETSSPSRITILRHSVLKILEGRDFTIDDTDAKQPVAIVNTSFARKYYGSESPIGRRIRIYNPGQPQAWRTIVGVVPDTLMQGPFDQQTDTAGFYMPLLGAEPATQFCTIIVRPRPGQRADTLGSALSKAVAELIQICRLISPERQRSSTMKFSVATELSRPYSAFSELSHSCSRRLAFTA